MDTRGYYKVSSWSISLSQEHDPKHTTDIVKEWLFLSVSKQT